MKLRFVGPHWRQEDLPPKRLLLKIRQAGCAGLEINTGALQDAPSWLRALDRWRCDHPANTRMLDYLKKRFASPESTLKNRS